MSKHLAAKYYEDNQKRLQSKVLKDTKVFLKKKMKKSNTMVVKDANISQKMKNKNWLSIEKNITK